MPRPIVKEPPKGSRLEKIVNGMRAEAATAKPFWQYTADDIRALEYGSRPDVDAEREAKVMRIIGAEALLRGEPRVWALPREAVRDYLVLPAIAKVDGPAAAESLQGTSTLERLVDLEREDAKRRSPAHKRLKPTEDIEAYVVLTVMAELYDGTEGETNNARYERVSLRLGPDIDRGAVRRADEEFRRRMGGLCERERSLVLTALIATRKLLVEFDALPRVQLGVG